MTRINLRTPVIKNIFDPGIAHTLDVDICINAMGGISCAN